MPRFLAAAGWLFAVLLPISAGALGLGEIDLKSRLNEPFVADIPLKLDDPADLDSVNVYLASVATFERYGLSRPAYLSDFRFFLSSDDSENGTVQVRSVRPVSEPFVTLLLEVEWPAGKLLREYTVLLDPPVFDVGAVATPVQPAESPAVAELPPDPIPEPVAATQPEAEPEPVAATVAPAPVIPVQELEPLPQEPEPEPEPPVAAATNLSLAGSTYGPVTVGQTLWGLAHELRPNLSVDINQMMLALYRTNPSAFVDNINRLKEGAILRIPDSDEIGAMTRTAAFAEAQRQHDQYQTSNVSVAGVQLRLVPPADEVLDSSSGGAAFETSATDVLESGPAASGVGEPEAEAEESSALLEIEDSGLAALQNRLGELDESDAIDTEAMIDIEADESSELDAGLQPSLAEPEEPAEASIIDSEEPAVVVSPGPEIDVVTSQAPDGESLLDRAIGLAEQYWMWGAGLLVAMVLLIGIRRRFAGGAAVKDQESGAEEDEFAGSWDDDESGAYVVDEATQDTGDQGAEFGANLDAMPGEAGAVDIPVEPEPAIDLPLEPEPAIDIPLEPEPAIDIPLEPEPEEEPDILLEPEHDDVLEATVRIDPEPEPLPEPDFDIDALLEAEPESEPVSEPEPEIDALPEPDLEAFDAMPEIPEAALEPTQEAPAPMAAEMPPVEEVAVDDVEGLLESTLSMPGPINLDQADPVAEAEFHMAYGLYDQAADLLIQALQEDQDNRDLRVKLLEVYFVWENKEGFLTEARTLREMTANDSDPDWNKVLIMGKQICADDELFSASPVGAGVDESMDLPLFSEDAAAAGVDVPIDDAGLSPAMEGAADPGLDLEIAGGSAADDADELDLDLGSDFSPDAETEVDLSLSPDSPTMESPTMDRPGPDSSDAGGIGLDDIGVDFGDVAGDDQTAGAGAVGDDDAETMIATEPVASGLTIGDEDATMLSSDAELAAMEAPFKPKEIDATADWPVLDEAALSDIGVDDLSAALGAGVGDETVEDFGATGATVEQPQPDNSASAVGLDELSETDTMKAPGLDDLPEEPTMTEVGTKLDLARAYIDMGDPDGARSILKEVLEEGDDSQQQEARQLLDELKD